ncbi:MAG: hypothetical protein Q8Q73_18625 [Stagnimonas sp.]|nr:hypothetical protein [Stagnimonas sp.]
MTRLTEGRLAHVFPAGWIAWKCDDASYYRNHFQSFAGGAKSVDFAAVGPENDPALWLIELKDYRAAPRTKPSDLFDELALKVRDTLACLLATASNSGMHPEVDQARAACKAGRVHVVFHLEQPRTPSKLFPQVVDPKDVKDKLKQKLRAVDPHPVWGNSAELGRKVAWVTV